MPDFCPFHKIYAWMMPQITVKTKIGFWKWGDAGSITLCFSEI